MKSPVPRSLLLTSPMLVGQDVVNWQRCLAALLPLNSAFTVDLKADGMFGEKTELATRELQRKLGVTPDGIVGPATTRAVSKYVGIEYYESFAPARPQQIVSQVNYEAFARNPFGLASKPSGVEKPEEQDDEVSQEYNWNAIIGSGL